MKKNKIVLSGIFPEKEPIYLDKEDELYGRNNPYKDWSDDDIDEELYNLEIWIVEDWLESKSADDKDKLKYGQLMWLKQ